MDDIISFFITTLDHTIQIQFGPKLMITNINKLKSLGVFQDYKPGKELYPFEKFNLFYGWNGSGKSTLGKLFWSIIDKKTHVHFNAAEYSIISTHCPEITQKNISTNEMNIRVFNRDFIDRNVNFEQSKANSILILSEEKKEDLVRYKDALSLLEKKQAEFNGSKRSYEKLNEALKKSLTTWAFNVKKSFELIETSNTYYLNYDRTKINTFIKANKENLIQASILTTDRVRELKNTIKPNRKADILTEQYLPVNTKDLLNKVEELKVILSQSVFSKQIERLVEHPDLNSWVEHGLELHTRLEGVNCEFCNQPLPKSRIEDLNNHFSQSYKILIDALKQQDAFINKMVHEISITFTEPSDLYEEFQSDYIESRRSHLENVQKCYDILKIITEHIEKKLNNPFEILTSQFDQTETILDQLNDGLKGMENIVAKHNFKNQKFDDIIKEAQQKLELHFVTEQLLKDNYQVSEKNIKRVGC